MRVIETDLAKIKWRTLSQEDQRVVGSWFDHLGNWEKDAFTRSHSRPLPGYEDSYVLETSTGLCIFFQVGGATLTVLDIAHRDTVRMFAPASTHGGA
jgi:hypothetical protein